MKIPITQAHDHRDIIGELKMDERRLPPDTDWGLAPGYRVLEDGTYELLELGLIYIDYKK